MATEILRPMAAGDYTACTPYGATYNWQCVDEVTPDEVSTCIYNTITTLQKDAYALEDTAIPAGSTINSVKVYFRFVEYLGNLGYKPFLRLGTDETAGTEIAPAGNNVWNTYNETLGRPGGGSWGVSDLNDLQVAIGLHSAAPTFYCNCTQVYVEVDYTIGFVPRIIIF